MIGIVVASDLEATPFLTFLKWQEISIQPFAVYKGELGPLKIPAVFIKSGMGKVAAAVAAHLLICQYGAAKIFNPGVCGALKDSIRFNPGSIFRINQAIEGDRQEGPFLVSPESCASDFFDMLPAANLVTCDKPVFKLQRKTELSALGDLIDMEGAAIARVANMYTCPCVLIKGVTDRAKEGDRRTLTQNIGMVSQKLADLFINTITSLVSVDDNSLSPKT